MSRLLKLKLFLWFALFATAGGFAGNASASSVLINQAGLCKPVPNKIIFVNGIMNSEEDATGSQYETLIALIAWGEVVGVDIDVVYNVSHWYVLDLLEALGQAVEPVFKPNIRKISELTVPQTLEPGEPVAAVTQQYTDKYGETDAITHELIDKTKRYISQGNSVTILAHSQGNFFANAAYLSVADSLATTGQDPELIHVVNVASPTSQSPNGYQINYQGDPVALLSLSATFPYDATTGYGHSFVKVYLLAGSDRLRGIQNAIRSARQRKVEPTSSVMLAPGQGGQSLATGPSAVLLSTAYTYTAPIVHIPADSTSFSLMETSAVSLVSSEDLTNIQSVTPSFTGADGMRLPLGLVASPSPEEALVRGGGWPNIVPSSNNIDYRCGSMSTSAGTLKYRWPTNSSGYTWTDTVFSELLPSGWASQAITGFKQVTLLSDPDSYWLTIATKFMEDGSYTLVITQRAPW